MNREEMRQLYAFCITTAAQIHAPYTYPNAETEVEAIRDTVRLLSQDIINFIPEGATNAEAPPAAETDPTL